MTDVSLLVYGLDLVNLACKLIMDISEPATQTGLNNVACMAPDASSDTAFDYISLLPVNRISPVRYVLLHNYETLITGTGHFDQLIISFGGSLHREMCQMSAFWNLNSAETLQGIN